MIAWNQIQYTRWCLKSVLRNSEGHDVEFHLLDNGSTDGQTYSALEGVNPVTLMRNERNESVYRGWNRVLAEALKRPYDVICLLSNDVVVGPGWLDGIAREIAKPDLRYLLPNGEWPEQVETFDETVRAALPGLVGQTKPGLAAWCMFFKPEAVRIFHPIPEDFILWYGDNYIHLALREKGYAGVAVMDCCAIHFLSKTFFATPGYTNIVEDDKRAFNILAQKRGWEQVP